ncbi:MAG: AAA family ATPase [Planctomycetaceae bacterium]|jgi:hypothetical protein|nr:AAA family ATPase [Planctomycetaceae bacterium]
MRVVTFYSFKGGVGRTTALINVAYRLARMGRKVVVADWDLQAPGLTMMDCMLPESGSRSARGVLEYLIGLRDGPKVSMPDIIVEPTFAVEAHGRKTIDNEPWMKGELFFIPAGNLEKRSLRTFIQAAAHELHDLRSLCGERPDKRFVFKVFCEDLRTSPIPWRRPTSSGAPDYLLVDCRSGISEISDLLLGDATDFNVMVYAQDEQNFDGLQLVLNAHPREPWELSATTMCIWTMEPPGQEELKFSRRKRIADLVDAICLKDTLGVRESFPQEYEIPYHPQLPLLTYPISHQFPQSEIAEQFLKIAKWIEQRCLSDETLAQPFGDGASVDSPQRAATQFKKALKSELTETTRDLDIARLDLELSRELLPFLFSPPTYNLAGKPTPDFIAWPDDCDPEDCEVILNLLAYTISLDALSPAQRAEWKNSRESSDQFAGVNQSLKGNEHLDRDMVIRTIPELDPRRIRELRRVFVEERAKFLTLSANHYWQLLKLTMASALEWLFVVQTHVSNPAPFKRAAGRLLAGKTISTVKISKSPLFQLLVAEAVESLGSTDSSRLKAYVERKGDISEVRHRLLTTCCEQLTEKEFSDDVRWFCWQSLGQSFYLRSARERDDQKMKRKLLRDGNKATDRALKYRPEEARSLILKGDILYELGECDKGAARIRAYDDSIALYQRAASTEDSNVRAHNDLGIALKTRGEHSGDDNVRLEFFAKARSAFERGIESKGSAARRNLARLFGRHAELTDDRPSAFTWRRSATEQWKKAVDSHPNDLNALTGFAIALVEEGRVAFRKAHRTGCLTTALDVWAHLCRVRPDSAFLLNQRVSTLLRLIRLKDNLTEWQTLLDEADWMIRQAMRLEPSEARYNYSCVLALQGEKTACLDQLEVLIKDDRKKRAQVAADADFKAVSRMKRFRALIAPQKWNPK